MLMVKATALVTGAPVAEPSCTLTKTVPALSSRLAGTAAVTWVGSTTVLVSAVVPAPLFQRTTEPAGKLVPVTTRVNATAPAWTELGFRVIGGAGLMVNVTVFELPAFGPEGLETVTNAFPATVTSDAGT